MHLGILLHLSSGAHQLCWEAEHALRSLMLWQLGERVVLPQVFCPGVGTCWIVSSGEFSLQVFPGCYRSRESVQCFPEGGGHSKTCQIPCQVSQCKPAQCLCLRPILKLFQQVLRELGWGCSTVWHGTACLDCSWGTRATVARCSGWGPVTRIHESEGANLNIKIS